MTQPRAPELQANPTTPHPAFFERVDAAGEAVEGAEEFIADVSTRGPWAADLQHAGPPSALLVRAAERLVPGMEVARFFCEMLRPVPIARLRVVAEVEKAGRKVVVVRARVLADERVCLDARIGCVRVADVGAPMRTHAGTPVSPDICAPFQFPFFTTPVGYHTAIECRVAHGAYGVGKMALWMRQRGPLVAGEEPSGAQRALVVADAGSGVSIGLDTRQFTFVNADLAVHLQRAPEGPWILMDATTWFERSGRGLAETALSDARGFVGRAGQTLVLEARSESTTS